MQTYSHFLMTWALERSGTRRGLWIHTAAFLVGAVLPDIPFLLLTLGYWGYYLWIAPIAADQTVMSVMEYMHFDLFFTDPVWIIGHNFFHAPLVLLAIGLIGAFLRHRWHWDNALLWFAVGAGLHTGLDIVTHHSDGPLIFFPFNWTYRFASPVSYWESEYYAGIFSAFEHALDVVLVGYLVWLWWRGRREREGRRKDATERERVRST